MVNTGERGKNGHNRRTRDQLSSSQNYIVWNVVVCIIGNVLWIYGSLLAVTGYYGLWKPVIVYGYGFATLFSINVGAHRLWAHRSFKAKFPLRIALLILQTAAGQNSVYEWVRDHRVHHKFTETDADPHNIKRGFFFAHMGWLLCKKHPDVKSKGKLVDMSDLESDPWIMWQHRHYPWLAPLFVLAIPTAAYATIFRTSVWEAFLFSGVTRYVFTLHGTWMVNSLAHLYGYKPYDKDIRATDSLFLGTIILGEGWHNYHHVFPWDYRASEYGGFDKNLGAALIDFFAWCGLTYDLKTVDPEIVKNRALRTGDGSHPVWGWGDKDISDDHVKMTLTLQPSLKTEKNIY